MPSWKKIITSGSDATLSSLTVTNVTASIVSASQFTGSLFGTASQALTASYVNPLNQTVIITGSLRVTGSTVLTGSTSINNLTYPTTDGTFASQVLQTNAAGTLSFGDVNTLYETIYNAEATTLTKGTVVYISGSQGANPKVYRADSSNPSKMPVSHVVAENIATLSTGRGVQLGLIIGINVTGINPGTQLWADGNGTLTTTRPTGSNDIIQPVAIVTKEGSGGQINVLNPGPVVLPNLTSGSVWVGNGSNYPTATLTSSLSVKQAVTSSYPIAVTGSTIYSTAPLSTNSPNLTDNIFLGSGSGFGATSVYKSNFLGYFSGRGAASAYNSNFIGEQAGDGSTAAYKSNFLGFAAGASAANAYESNFFGVYAGASATSANFSNFFGTIAGNGATSAYQSNFLGPWSGQSATNANNSNFLGYYAGNGASSANNSNFLGQSAGLQASSANNSNFLGQYAGSQAAGANNSNFLGNSAGDGATSANDSNFLGHNAGNRATAAAGSNFLGNSAGAGAGGAYESNFLGFYAGSGSTDAYYSNFLGSYSGQEAQNAYYSNFLGNFAGKGATDANNSNFLGYNTGLNATAAANSNFLGQEAGTGASNASDSNFLGYLAGAGAVTARYSNFLGARAGYLAELADNSNFLGQDAGNGATSANNSNFLGQNAGTSATNAYQSNFLGFTAGFGASSATDSNFIGTSAGNGATTAYQSNFIGVGAGFSATNANNSNFLGNFAGNGAIDANDSNFLGRGAGMNSPSASYSNFLGYYSGFNILYGGAYSTLIGYNVANNYDLINDTPIGNGIGQNNIIIGTNITLADGRNNAINLGGLIFGTGSYSTTSGNPFSGSAGGRIGINQPTPIYTLDVSGSGNYTNGLRVTGSFTVITGSAIEFEVLNTGVRIGSTTTDTHTVTGSFNISGSQTTVGNTTLSGSLTFSPGTSPSFNGEIVRFGSGTLTQGQLYFLSSSGTWSLANANSISSSVGMLGLAVGSSPTANGLLIRGFAVSSSYTYGTGSVIYAATSSGLMTATSPSSSNHVVRVLGYQTSLSNTIYFDPDKTWVTLA